MSEKKSPLSADIHLLGDILGQVIRDQHGEDGFQLVETIRKAALARRDGDENATETLTKTVRRIDLDAQQVLIKAFSNYFQLINIAEDMQRIRVLRDREMADRLRESLQDAIGTLHEAGMSADELKALLGKLRVRLVMTAHPTEAKRKEILLKLRHIADNLATLDQTQLLPLEAREVQADLYEEIEEMWQTRPTRTTKPTVQDEFDFGMYFITSSIMEVAVRLHIELKMIVEDHYPDADWSHLPPLIQYASWVGADRDGNPFVTPQVTLDSLATLRKAAREVYLEDVAYLREHLTQSEDEAPVSQEMASALAAEFIDEDEVRFPGEVYRQMMTAIRRKLKEDLYPTGEDFLKDLLIIQRSLLANRGQRVAEGSLERLIWKVRLFGLHLVPLEVREDARRTAAVIDELFRHYDIAEDFLNLPESEKQALLVHEIANPRPLFPRHERFSGTVNDIIAIWRMIATAHQDHGPRAIDTVIASMSQQPSDVLIMLLLATEVGVAQDIDIVPLFETINDLHNAPDVMQTLFENEAYAAQLEARGKHQVIMIGYSDSSKDGGYLASTWGLYSAQEKLALACIEHDIALELFHGRGGSIGRGGGPASRAILAGPPAAMGGRIRMTEQGEVIAYRYGNPGIARRHLHQVVHGALLATARPADRDHRPEWFAAMDEMAEDARAAYRNFVYESEGFLDYWQRATPINEISRLQIGSRPAKRRKGGFEAIRAIPWVFSWMQNRAIIPSWYGVGTGLKRFTTSRADGLATLQMMYSEWDFFKASMENIQLDLAKADMGIAAMYSSLVEDADLRDRFFMRIKDEHALAVSLINQIIGQQSLLANAPVLKRSIERRNPYVDPLNFIQVQLIRELRGMDEDHDFELGQEILRAIFASINGIAAGMKTTG